MKKILSVIAIGPSALLLAGCAHYNFYQVDFETQLGTIKEDYCTGVTIAAMDYYIDIQLEGKKYSEEMDNVFRISDVCYETVEITKTESELTVSYIENTEYSFFESSGFETQTVLYDDMNNVSAALEVDGSGKYSYEKFIELYNLQLEDIKEATSTHHGLENYIKNFDFSPYVDADELTLKIHDAIDDMNIHMDLYIPMYFIDSSEYVTDISSIEYKSTIDLCNEDDLKYDKLLIKFRRKSHFHAGFYKSSYYNYTLELLELERLQNHDTYGLVMGANSTVYIPVQVTFPNVPCQ